MSIVLELTPEVEEELQAQADARGVTLADYAREILAQRAAHCDSAPAGRHANNLYELFAPVRGLLTDEEVEQSFARNRLPSRPIDLE